MVWYMQVITPSQSLILSAETRRDMEEWMSALKAASSREFYDVCSPFFLLPSDLIELAFLRPHFSQLDAILSSIRQLVLLQYDKITDFMKSALFHQVSEQLALFSGQHNWYVCSHARPTYCNICRDVLSGVASNGLSCEGQLFSKSQVPDILTISVRLKVDLLLIFFVSFLRQSFQQFFAELFWSSHE